MFSKNSAIFLVSILFLAAGLSAGYYLGLKAANMNCNMDSSYSDPVNRSIFRTEIKTELTVKEAYKIAFSESGLWAADGYLFGIELVSNKFGVDGASSGWKFIFYSKMKNKFYEILIKNGESRVGKEKVSEIKNAPQTLKGEMIDSTILAKSFFGLYPEDTKIISLKMHYDEGAKKFLWTIFFPNGSHTIDAEL